MPNWLNTRLYDYIMPQEYYYTTDQMGRNILVPHSPKRIISLVPSQTELLYYLGLTDEVVGQTQFCIHPKSQHQIKPSVGGTKKLKLEVIASLKPDLVIGNKEENEQQQIEELMKHYPVWLSDIKTLNDACQMIISVGRLINKTHEAEELQRSIINGFSTLPKLQNATCLYFIWRKPWMLAGHNTFINDLLYKIGLSNLAKNLDARYPVINADEIAKLSPNYIFLSSEPYPFKQIHIDELQLISPHSSIKLVDGEMFSWYGNRLIPAIAYFKNLRH